MLGAVAIGNGAHAYPMLPAQLSGETPTELRDPRAPSALPCSGDRWNRTCHQSMCTRAAVEGTRTTPGCPRRSLTATGAVLQSMRPPPSIPDRCPSSSSTGESEREVSSPRSSGGDLPVRNAWSRTTGSVWAPPVPLFFHRLRTSTGWLRSCAVRTPTRHRRRGPASKGGRHSGMTTSLRVARQHSPPRPPGVAEARYAWGLACARGAGIRNDVRWGRGYGYPACCVAMFCWDRTLGRAPSWRRATHAALSADQPAFVPCGVFHARSRGLTTTQAAARVLRCELRALRWLAPRTLRDRREVAALEALCAAEACYRNSDPCDPATQNPDLDQELEWS